VSCLKELEDHQLRAEEGLVPFVLIAAVLVAVFLRRRSGARGEAGRRQDFRRP
jgi:hypothetical protein